MLEYIYTGYKKGEFIMGLTVYHNRVNEELKQVIKPHAETKEHILDFIAELKKEGYKIIEYPPIEKVHKVYCTTLIVQVPRI